jgi:hypothetical protein
VSPDTVRGVCTETSIFAGSLESIRHEVVGVEDRDLQALDEEDPVVIST